MVLMAQQGLLVVQVLQDLLAHKDPLVPQAHKDPQVLMVLMVAMEEQDPLVPQGQLAPVVQPPVSIHLLPLLVR